MKPVRNIKDIEDNFEERFTQPENENGYVIDEVLEKTVEIKNIKKFISQQITELLEQIPIQKLEFFMLRQDGKSQYVISSEEIKQILNNIKK